MPTNFSVTSVYTDAGRAKYAAATGNLGVFDYVTTFKVGLGGWTPIGAPRTPDPSLTDLDIVIDQTRPLVDKRYPLITAPPYNITFTKGAGAMSVSGNILTVPCQLLNVEYNDDGTGNPPVIWEIGLFDNSGLMLVYGTFSGITKDGTKSIDFSNALVF